MAKTEITKPAPGTPSRPRDMFGAMRDEMERMFERLEHGLARWPSVFRHGNLVPELDVRENATSITIEAELPGVEEKDISVTFANGVLAIRGEKKQVREARTCTSRSAALVRSSGPCISPRVWTRARWTPVSTRASLRSQPQRSRRP